MTDLPKTVLYPSAFVRSATAGNDGVWDWEFLSGIFPRPVIKPMDIDGKVEINGYFLFFETKDEKKPIPGGQARALASLLYELRKKGALIILRGKIIPVCWEAVSWYGPLNQERSYGSDCREEIVSYCKRWGEWANQHPRVKNSETEKIFDRIFLS